MKYENILKNPEAYLKNLNEVIIENVELYRLLMETTYIQNQMEKIKKVLVDDVVNAIELPDNIEDINLFKIRCNFFVGGIVNTYQQWLRGDLNCSIDEMTKEMVIIIKESAKEFIEIK